MNGILRLMTLTLLLSFSLITKSQVYTNLGDIQTDERALYTMTKQMSQFISRFNYEEDQYGKKLSPDNPDYRDRMKRKTVLPLLLRNYTSASTDV
mgnify:CR=1 FL=1